MAFGRMFKNVTGNVKKVVKKTGDKTKSAIGTLLGNETQKVVEPVYADAPPKMVMPEAKPLQDAPPPKNPPSDGFKIFGMNVNNPANQIKSSVDKMNESLSNIGKNAANAVKKPIMTISENYGKPNDVTYRVPPNVVTPGEVDRSGATVDTKNVTRDDIKVAPDEKVDYGATKTSEAYDSAIAELSGVAAGKGKSGTNAAIAEGRQALAAASKQAQAQAGAAAQREGALGQGTANSLSQQTRLSTLQEMAGQELGFAQLRQADQDAAIDRIIQAEQAEKDDIISAEGIELQKSGQYLNIEQMNRQFDHMDADLREKIAARIQAGKQFDINQLNDIYKFEKSMELTEKQWEAEFGAEQANRHMAHLLELSVDNPVLAKKIQSHLLTGGTGDLGDFTADEVAEIERLKQRAEQQEDDVNNIYAKQLELLDKQLTAETVTATEELAGKAETASNIQKVISGEIDVSELEASDWEQATRRQIESMGIKELSQDTYFRTGDFTKSGLKADIVESNTDDKSRSKDASSAGDGKGSIVMVQGTPYRLVRYWTKKDTTGTNERRGRLYGIPLDGSGNGKEVLLRDTGWRDL